MIRKQLGIFSPKFKGFANNYPKKLMTAFNKVFISKQTYLLMIV